jgi:hypothetical protein
LAAAAVTFLLLAAACFSLQQKDDAVRLNLAGRQRMLSQKMAKELLQRLHHAAHPSSLQWTMHVFETTLDALIRGGPVLMINGAEQARALAAESHLATRRRLEAVALKWASIRPRLQQLMDRPGTRSLPLAKDWDLALLQALDQAVRSIEEDIQLTSTRITACLLGVGILVLLVLSTILYRLGIGLRQANHELTELRRLLPICSGCKAIRTNDAHPSDPASWQPIESYLQQKNHRDLTHGLCPLCVQRLYSEFLPKS